MRKLLQDYSLIGVVLLFSSFAVGIFLRTYDLSSLSTWSDEIASWYFAKHLDQVFVTESHTPFYYSFIRFFFGSDPNIASIRVFSALISILHLIVFFFLGQKAFEKNKFIIFFILIALNPIDIVFARMGRHYSWLLESVLLFILLLRLNKSIWMLAVQAFIASFLHVFGLIPITIALVFDYIKNKNLKRLLIVMSTAGSVLIYYLLRFLIFGKEKVASNVGWNSSTFFVFIKSLAVQFLGGTYPRDTVYPVSLVLSIFVLLLLFGFILYKRKLSSLYFFTTLVFALLFIELMGLFGMNLRISRLIVYLSGLLILAIADSFERPGNWVPTAVFILSLTYITYLNPIKTYEWNDEAVKKWHSFKSHYTYAQEVICTTNYQADYYQLDTNLCLNPQLIDKNKPVIFFIVHGSWLIPDIT